MNKRTFNISFPLEFIQCPHCNQWVHILVGFFGADDWELDTEEIWTAGNENTFCPACGEKMKEKPTDQTIQMMLQKNIKDTN